MAVRARQEVTLGKIFRDEGFVCVRYISDWASPKFGPNPKSKEKSWNVFRMQLIPSAPSL